MFGFAPGECTRRRLEGVIPLERDCQCGYDCRDLHDHNARSGRIMKLVGSPSSMLMMMCDVCGGDACDADGES